MAGPVPRSLDERPPHVALFLPTLGGGGAERVMLTLAQGFVQRGIRVDLVLSKAVGSYAGEVPSGVRMIDLRARRVISSLPRLVRYLRAERPAVLLTTMNHANVAALLARRLARTSTRIVVREANTPSVSARSGSIRNRLMLALVRLCYRWADEIVAVSEGVADDLQKVTALPRSRIQVLPNPIITADLAGQAAEPLDDPWFTPDAPPVILGVGALRKQKDFPTLIRAFAELRSRREARLIILGEGTERSSLESLLQGLGVAADARLPGRIPNPYNYMAKAAVFVLSSAWEGMPGVLIQALGCGARVVATDCESGPRELLAGGEFGQLVPVGDSAALAGAIATSLDRPRRPLPDSVLAPYTQDGAVDRYVRLLRIADLHV
jgi:glycosyltransferase involved in cell wall biosynthesis